MVTVVRFAKRAEKDLDRIPDFIREKLLRWVSAIELDGLAEVRKIPGYHDEPLTGDRKGQRSIRLNRSYRAIYVVKRDEIEFVNIEEVNKHEY